MYGSVSDVYGELTLFSSLMPSDRTSENPLWGSEEPFWDDFYTLCETYLSEFDIESTMTDVMLGDIFRCTISLYHIIQPTYYESMIIGLINIFK